ncbi:MAG: response regulator [Deltaproteobacteria bacterium]|nr:MAG: response regulator [Deltaproteobacteria bacterium]
MPCSTWCETASRTGSSPRRSGSRPGSRRWAGCRWTSSGEGTAWPSPAAMTGAASTSRRCAGPPCSGVFSPPRSRTTSKAVTQVAGRGIGLDVLRETAARLKGDVTVLTAAGVGTTVEVSVPVSLSLLAALAVDAAGIALLPLDAVRETLHLAERDIARSAGGDRILYEGHPIPFLPLADALGRQAACRRNGRPWSVVIVRSGSGLAALGVERLLGITHVVVRPLPALAVADPVVACASTDADGSPQLMLDPAGLVAAAAGTRPLAAEVAEPARLPLLVVDDSLTTRMLEQSILESAGYEVDVASSAEEALAKAQARRYGMFLVDVEMPGMDGFEFVARTRADPILREVPAILVTSRSSQEDRRRGTESGARDYIAKSPDRPCRRSASWWSRTPSPSASASSRC